MTKSPIIVANGVGKAFGDFHALTDVHMTVHKNERVVVCGPSGSGKSTLIRCFNGLENHSSGNLTVGGIELYPDSPEIRQLRQDVGMVFQQFNLFPHLTVLENLMIGPMKVRKLDRAQAEATARKYLERVRIP
jgi:ABC-type polar amino acid transport system ATPase subunit